MRRTKSAAPLSLWPLLLRTMAGFAAILMLAGAVPAAHTLDARAFGWHRPTPLERDHSW